MASTFRKTKALKQVFFWTIFLIAPITKGQEIVRFPADTNLCETDPWKLVWGDEFEGKALDTTKWYRFIDDDNWFDGVVADPPVSTASRASYKVIYRDENVVVNNGTCTLTLKYDPSVWKGTAKNFSSGMIMAKNAEGTAPLYFNRGKFEMKAKLPRATGVWATFWLYGGGSNNQQGSEIDMVEYAPCKSSLSEIPYHVHGFRRGDNFAEHYETGGNYKLKDVDQWHIYTTEWDRHFIRFFLDGMLMAVVSRYNSDCKPGSETDYLHDAKNVFPRIDEGMKMLVTLDYTHNLYSTQVAGICLPWPAWLRNRAKADARQPEQKIEIDYIRVYQREGEIQENLRNKD